MATLQHSRLLLQPLCGRWSDGVHALRLAAALSKTTSLNGSSNTTTSLATSIECLLTSYFNFQKTDQRTRQPTDASATIRKRRFHTLLEKSSSTHFNGIPSSPITCAKTIFLVAFKRQPTCKAAKGVGAAQSASNRRASKTAFRLLHGTEWITFPRARALDFKLFLAFHRIRRSSSVGRVRTSINTTISR
jgi:hypothetical protein